VWQLLVPISTTVVLFLLGAAFAFVLAEPSHMLARRLGGKRMLGILVAYLISFAIVISIILVLAAPLVSQASALVANLPMYAAGVQTQAHGLQTRLDAQGVQLNVDAIASQVIAFVTSTLTDLLQAVIAAASGIGGLLMNAVLVLVISVYLLTDAPSVQRHARHAVPMRYRGVHTFIRSSAARVMGGYLRGELIMAAVIGLLAGVGTGLLGLPYFVVLGVLAGMFELIPMFGPILSAVPAVLVALFMPWPTVVWVIILFVIIQQFECNVLGPKVTGHAVGLHPLGSMFALMVGFEVAGILGGLFAVPVAGVIWVLSSTAYRNLVDLEPLNEIEEQVVHLGAVATGPSTGH
jgi:predicted PurR-regulated permease PerM